MWIRKSEEMIGNMITKEGRENGKNVDFWKVEMKGIKGIEER